MRYTYLTNKRLNKNEDYSRFFLKPLQLLGELYVKKYTIFVGHINYGMHKIILTTILIIPLLFSCTGKRESTPTYLHIESINFQYDNLSTIGNGGTAITDAWVFNNDNLLGVFELPATVAITTEGIQNISIHGGIKLNGISATRESYPFYEPWTTTVDLQPLDTAFIEPSIHYYAETGISFNESFEEIIIKYDSTPYSDVVLERTKAIDQPSFIEGYSGLATLTSDQPNFSAYNKDLFSVPTTSALPLYLELDYKCNQEFTVSGLVSETGVGITEIRILTLRSTEEEGEMKWKHIYIDLTDYFLGRVTATGFGLTFSAVYDSDNPEGYIYLDNTKVVNTP